MIPSRLFKGLVRESITLPERIKILCFESLRSSKKTVRSSQTWTKTTTISRQAPESPPVLELKLAPRQDPASADPKASSDKTHQRWRWPPGKSRERELAGSKSSLRKSPRTFPPVTTLYLFSNSLMPSQTTRHLDRTRSKVRGRDEMKDKAEVSSLCKWTRKLCFSSKHHQSQSTNSSIHTRTCQQTHHKKGTNIIRSYPQSKSQSASSK